MHAVFRARCQREPSGHLAGAELRTDLRWLADITSPVRDYDVLGLAVEQMRETISPELHGAIKEVHEEIDRSKSEPRQKLDAALESARYAALKARWRDLAGRPPHTGSLTSAPQAAMLAIDFSRQTIWRAYKRVRNGGREIGPAAPDEGLHELRKMAKRLRYLMEGFKSLHPSKEIASSLSQLKSLQDVLGAFQDGVVHSEDLRVIVKARSGEISTEALMAPGALVDRFGSKQLTARQQFMSQFAEFDSAENQAKFRALFKADPDQETAPTDVIGVL